MKVQEAIQMMKHRIETAKEIVGKGADGKAFEDMEIAIECMEKQIPKKPTEFNAITNGKFYALDFMCPSCNEPNIGNPYAPKYCKHCGQALKWGEEDD